MRGASSVCRALIFSWEATAPPSMIPWSEPGGMIRGLPDAVPSVGAGFTSQSAANVLLATTRHRHFQNCRTTGTPRHLSLDFGGSHGQDSCGTEAEESISPLILLRACLHSPSHEERTPMPYLLNLLYLLAIFLLSP